MDLLGTDPTSEQQTPGGPQPAQAAAGPSASTRQIASAAPAASAPVPEASQQPAQPPPGSPPPPATSDDDQAAKAAGFSDDEISTEKERQKMAAAGFSQKEIDEQFPEKPYIPPQPDLSAGKAFVDKNIQDHIEELGRDNSTPKPTSFMDGFWRALTGLKNDISTGFQAGYQDSVTGLVTRVKMPDVVLPQNADMAMKIASLSAHFAGDLPAMVLGGVIGGAAGTEAPVVGNVVGGLAGGFAAPAAIRRYYIDRLQKGEVQNFGDLFSRMAAITWDGMKGATTGASMGLAGGAAAGALANTALSPLLQEGGKLAAELGTMTFVGSALENQVPKSEEFGYNALAMMAFHGAGKALGTPLDAVPIEKKLQTIYAETGLKPAQVIGQAEMDPVLKQELLSNREGLPPSLEKLADPTAPNQDHLFPEGPQMMKARPPDHLTEQNGVLNSDYAPDGDYKVLKNDLPLSDQTKAAMAAEGGGKKPPSEPPPENPDRDAVLSRFGEEADKKTTWADRKEQYLDRLDPIARVTRLLKGENDIPGDQDPLKLMREADNSAAIAKSILDYGPIHFGDEGNEAGSRTGTEGINQILKGFDGEQLSDIQAYWASKHALELSEREIDTGIPLDKAQAVVDQLQGKYDGVVKKLVNFQNENLKYLADSQVIPREVYEESIRKFEYYMPTNRITEEGLGSGTKSPVNPIKAKVGSDLKIANPFESMVKNVYQYTKLAELNRSKLAMLDLADRSLEGAELFKKVPTPVKPIKITPEEVINNLAKQGIDVNGDPEAFNVFRRMAVPLADDQIFAMRDGQMDVRQTTEALARAYNGTDFQIPGLAKFFQGFASIARMGAVDTPGFLAKHLIRGEALAWMFTKNGYVPYATSMRGLFEQFFKTQDYKDFLGGGGGMANAIDLDKNYFQKNVFDLNKKTGILDQTLNLIRNPMDAVHALMEMMRKPAEYISNAPRVGEFSQARARGKSIKEAAYDARNVAVDNSVRGTSLSTQIISLDAPFWRDKINGLQQLWTAFDEDPVGVGGKLATISAISALLVARNYSNPLYKEAYQDADRWEKDLYWLMPFGDSKQNMTMMKIPKPFEAGVLFGSGTERALEYALTKDPNAFKGFARELLGSAVPVPQVTALMPMAEQYMNKSFLTGGNLVPEAMKDIAPAYQYKPYTTSAAKILGKFIGQVPVLNELGHENITVASPLIIENYVRQWSGSMGMYALRKASDLLEAAGVAPPQVKPADTLVDKPIISSFIARWPSLGAAPIQDFYDNLQSTRTAQKTVGALAKRGEQEQASDFISSPFYQMNQAKLETISKSIGAQNAMIQYIYSNPSMKPAEKTQQIQAYYYQIIQQAKLGNQIYNQLQQITKP